MPTFFENDLSLQSYWRSIILYGKNVASYKFALAKSLIDLKKNKNDLVKIEDLSNLFANHICEHLKNNDKQITSNSSEFLNTLKKYNLGEVDLGKRNLITAKQGFNNVIDAFHVVNGKSIENPFFIDERKLNKGIRLTDSFHNLLDIKESENFYSEVEARWRLVETAWKLGLATKLVQVQYDSVNDDFYVDDKKKRINVTSSKNALNGYQKSKCFFCYDYISIINKSENLCNVDHFFPHYLKNANFEGYVDGIWNLVLACESCNKGINGKFAKLPTIKLLERLNRRNEYFCSSHHPLKETIIQQTGETEKKRKAFLQKSFDEAKEILLHTWEPEAKASSVF
jgi:hypothetical protein